MSSKKNKIVRVREIMKTGFTSIDGNATISEALELMKSSGTSVLVVNKRHGDDGIRPDHLGRYRS